MSKETVQPGEFNARATFFWRASSIGDAPLPSSAGRRNPTG
jgi:hypothetical protein